MKKEVRQLIIHCDCVEGLSESCNHLEIYDLADGDFEINGVFLKKESVEKVITFLNEK